MLNVVSVAYLLGCDNQYKMKVKSQWLYLQVRRKRFFKWNFFYLFNYFRLLSSLLWLLSAQLLQLQQTLQTTETMKILW